MLSELSVLEYISGGSGGGGGETDVRVQVNFNNEPNRLQTTVSCF